MGCNSLVGDDINDPDRHYKVNHMNSNVRTLVLCGFRVATLDEEQRREFVVKRGLYKSIWKKVCPWEMLQRETRRLFGEAEFDYVVRFSGI